MSRQVISTSLSVGLATGLYGVSFGAIGSAAGLGVPSVMLLSLVMFSARVNLHLLDHRGWGSTNHRNFVGLADGCPKLFLWTSIECRDWS